MKLLHVITGLGKAAGTSVFCAEVANALASRGHEVAVAKFNPGATDIYPLDPSVRQIAIDAAPDASFPPGERPDVIHVHALWTPVLCRWARWAHLRGIPVVWSIHGMATPWAMHSKRLKKSIAWHLYQRRALAAADLIHVTAEREIEDIRGLGLGNAVVQAPLGIDTAAIDRFLKGRERPQAPQKTLLFAGRINRIKGLDRLVRAWSVVPRHLRESWRVRLVGPDQENHTDELRALCADAGISGEWEFAGPRYGEDLYAEYAAANLLVLPSHTENFGSVVLEALAFGVPVVATKGTPWGILEECKCGRHVEGNGESIAAALSEIMSADDEARRQMGARGRHLVEEKFTWSAVADILERAYFSISRTAK